MVIVSIAALLQTEGNQERALELAKYVRNHAHSYAVDRAKAIRLITQFEETALDTATEAFREQTRRLHLEEIVSLLITDEQQISELARGFD